jgi:hypothetical protein
VKDRPPACRSIRARRALGIHHGDHTARAVCPGVLGDFLRNFLRNKEFALAHHLGHALFIGARAIEKGLDGKRSVDHRNHGRHIGSAGDTDAKLVWYDTTLPDDLLKRTAAQAPEPRPLA